jgi:hypothetical protein
MSAWKDEQIQQREIEAQFDRGISYAMYTIQKMNEEQMWYEYAEDNRFQLADGFVLEGTPITI